MPIMRTPPPENVAGHYGEYETYSKLVLLELPDVEFWFNLEFPTVPEIDLIFNHPQLGAYIAEIKAMRLDEIASYTLDTLTRSDGKNSQQPVKQIKRAEFALRDYLERHRGALRTPYLQKTVIWPRITRDEWNRRFDNPVIKDQAFGMIFADDLYNANEFQDALATITENPLGAPVPLSVRTNQQGIQILRILTDFESINLPKPTKVVENILTTRELADLRSSPAKSDVRSTKFKANGNDLVMFRGYPGSGKTTALRDLGIEHARAGNSVLFICFNKVLATKVRQEVTILLTREGIKESLFTVADQFQFYKIVFPDLARTNKRVLVDHARELQKIGDLITYDTILLDEAQDIDGEFLDFIKCLRDEKSSLFFAFAEGQQLYNLDRYPNGKSPQLAELIEKAEPQQFNRVFRTGPTSQLVCAAVADFYPDTKAGEKWLSDQLAKRSSQADDLQLDFEGFTFEPVIHLLDKPSDSRADRYLFELVENLIEASSSDNGDVDGLIIVSGKGSRSYLDITKYLKLMNIPFSDLVQDHLKRSVTPRNAIRISTYQGARGLTATNTLVLDAGYIETNYITSDKPSKNNVFNIALSRATQTTVVYSGTNFDASDRPILASYLQSMLGELQ
jgi:hypothetical protein